MTNAQKGYYKAATPRKTQPNIGATMSEENAYESVQDVLAIANPWQECLERKISKRVMQAFGIRTRKDVYGDTLAWYFPYYKLVDGEPKLVGFKKKTAANTGGKSDYTTLGPVDVNCLLFGAVMHRSDTGAAYVSKCKGKPRIIITEGEFDAAACMEAAIQFDQAKMYPVITSIGFGTKNAVQHISAKVNQEFLGRFEAPVIAFDNDSATPAEYAKGIRKGTDATKDVADYLGADNMRLCVLPKDYDANDMLVEGRGKDLFWAFTMPKAYNIAGFATYEALQTLATKLPMIGRPWPWKDLTKLTLGRRLGEGYYLGSGVKQGKSELLNQIVQHILETEDAPPTLFKFEEEPHITCKKIAGKLAHKSFTNPEQVVFTSEDGTEVDVWGEVIPKQFRHTYFTEEELKEACDAVGDRVIYYNNYGHANWTEIAEKIRYAVTVLGSKDIFIDPLTRLTVGMTAAQANEELERIADSLSVMAKDLGFTYYIFCHLKAPAQGKPHEKGGKVESYQFTGSRAMMRSCYYMIGLERDKSDDLPDIVRNSSELVLLEDRQFGRTGRVKLFYDKRTGDYREHTAEELYQYTEELRKLEE